MAFEQTLIHIRERSFLDLLDLALVVVRRRPLILGLAALLGVAPWAALNAWLIGEEPGNGWMLPFLLLWEAPWATGPLTYVLGDLMFGARSRSGRLIATLGRAFVPMVLYQGLLRAFLIFIPILIPLIPARLAFLDEVLLLERGRWTTALGRSGRLCADRGILLFLIWMVHLGFGLLFVAAFWLATGVLTQTMVREITWDQPGWGDLVDWRVQVGAWIAVAFFGVVRFLTYIDQRIRLEGWEVELRLRSVGAALEDAERW